MKIKTQQAISLPCFLTSKPKITNLAVPSDEAVKSSLPAKDQAISYKIPKWPESSPCNAPDGILEEKIILDTVHLRITAVTCPCLLGTPGESHGLFILANKLLNDSKKLL